MKYADIVAAVDAGKRVLFYCINSEQRYFYKKQLHHRGAHLVRVGTRLRHPVGDGFCHFVVEPRECLGIDYDLAATPLPAVMAARIRPRDPA